jgi:hypothetical protein
VWQSCGLTLPSCLRCAAQSTVDQLFRIMRMFGPLPSYMEARMRSDTRLVAIKEVPARGRSLATRLADKGGPRLLQFLQACLVLEPERRATAHELIQSSYCFEMLEQVSARQRQALPIPPSPTPRATRPPQVAGTPLAKMVIRELKLKAPSAEPKIAPPPEPTSAPPAAPQPAADAAAGRGALGVHVSAPPPELMLFGTSAACEMEIAVQRAQCAVHVSAPPPELLPAPQPAAASSREGPDEAAASPFQNPVNAINAAASIAKQHFPSTQAASRGPAGASHAPQASGPCTEAPPCVLPPSPAMRVQLPAQEARPYASYVIWCVFCFYPCLRCPR